MNEFLYNLLNSQSFWVVIAIWVFVCIGWAERWRPVLNRLGKLISKPVIFRKDQEPGDVPFYPRMFLEDASIGFQDVLRRPFSGFIIVFSRWVNALIDIVYNKHHPFRTLGHLLFLISFLFFVLVDAIAITNTLAIIGVSLGAVPSILTRFDVAVFGGSLLALVIGMTLLFEVRSSQSEFSLFSERDERTKSLVLGMTLVVVILSFITLVAWALFRLVALGELDRTSTLDLLLNFALYGLVPINSALVAAILFPEALRGISVIAILFAWVVMGNLYILDYLATILSSLLPFFFDIAYRLIYITIDLLQWIVSTPIQAIILPFRLIFSVFSAGESFDERNRSQRK